MFGETAMTQLADLGSQYWAFCSSHLFAESAEQWAHNESFLDAEGNSAEGLPNHTLKWAQGVLRSGDLIVWSSDLCDIIEQVAETLPTTWVMPERAAADRSLSVFERPIALRGDSVSAILLGPTAFRKKSGPSRLQVKLPDDDPIDTQPAVVFAGNRLMEPTDGYRTERLIDWMGYWAEGTAVGDFSEVRPIERIVAAVVEIANQRIAARSLDRPSRAERRRQGSFTREVTTIILRRLASQGGGHHDAADVDWSCRWIVRPHWRNQWMPAAGAHRPRLINAYVKGPGDKPLRLTKRTFLGVR